MTIQPYYHYSAIDDFEIVRRRARREAFLAALLKRENQLINFSDLKPLLPRQKLVSNLLNSL